MTTNQIAYWNFKETQRANKAREGIQQGTLEETVRANVTKEKETERANKAKEGIQIADNVAKAATSASKEIREWVNLFK